MNLIAYYINKEGLMLDIKEIIFLVWKNQNHYQVLLIDMPYLYKKIYIIIMNIIKLIIMIFII